MKLKDSENVLVLGGFLALTGILAGLILAYFSDLTAAPIAAAKTRSTNEALQSVLPAFDNNPGELTVEQGGVKFYLALKDGKLAGVAGEGRGKGYGGDITALVGILPDGAVRTVLITGQTETPGLGTVVCERKVTKTIFTLFDKSASAPAGQLPPNRILDGFAGERAVAGQPWKVQKDGGKFAYQTGATVTSRAVTDLVYQIDLAYRQAAKEILAAAGKGGR